MSVMEAIISQPIVITDMKLPVLHVSSKLFQVFYPGVRIKSIFSADA